MSIDLKNKKMDDFTYFTRRTLSNKKGEEKGRALVVVEKGSTMAKIEYTCPFCEKSDLLYM